MAAKSEGQTDQRQERISKAWIDAGDLVLKFEDTATEALLPGIESGRLAAVIHQIVAASTKAEVRSFHAMDGSPEVEGGPAGQVADLVRGGHVIEADIAIESSFPDFAFWHTLTVSQKGGQLYNLKITWWGDMTFEKPVSHKARFAAIVNYLYDIQELCGAEGIWVAQKTCTTPSEAPECWVQI